MTTSNVNFSFIKIKAVWELFSDYSNASTLHGVRYMGEKSRHWAERFLFYL